MVSTAYQKAMTAAEHHLFQKILDFPLDPPGAVFPFSYKLAWEYQWTNLYTLRAIDEYKKFVFLTVTANHMVSPATPVDRVWHLHLLYTHSYWDDFCGQVLGKPLHHTPSLGGRREGKKYQRVYEQTLFTYRQYFGDPPADIWHPPRLRSESFDFQWVNRHQYWLIPHPVYVLKKLMAS